MLGALHAQVVEQLRGFERFVLRIEADAELLEDILVGANQHEFSTLPIEEVWRIDRDEPPTAESITQTLRQIGTVLTIEYESRKACSNALGGRGPMTLTFLGTRGEIDIRTRRHRRHTSTLVSNRGSRVMIDCGTDWVREVHRLGPDAIVLTHAHPDHVDGLRHGSPCPVYAPFPVWQAIASWPIDDRHRLALRAPADIRGIQFEAFTLDHSVIAPAVGYRIRAGRQTVFYAPDVLRIRHTMAALRDVDLYIGDGATIERPIVRIERRKGVPVGHASIATQLEWCARVAVPDAIFTHCGRAIVAGPTDVERRISDLGRTHDVDARVAQDGLRVRLQ